MKCYLIFIYKLNKFTDKTNLISIPSLLSSPTRTSALFNLISSLSLFTINSVEVRPVLK